MIWCPIFLYASTMLWNYLCDESFDGDRLCCCFQGRLKTYLFNRSFSSVAQSDFQVYHFIYQYIMLLICMYSFRSLWIFLSLKMYILLISYVRVTQRFELLERKALYKYLIVLLYYFLHSTVLKKVKTVSTFKSRLKTFFKQYFYKK